MSESPWDTREDVLAPYGAAWGKVITAYTRKIETLEDEELEILIDACSHGRWHHEITGNNYYASIEVERIALGEQRRRAARR